MKTMTLGTLLVPPEALPLLIALAGLMLIIGLKKLAAGLGLLAFVCLLAPMLEPIIDEVLSQLPAWVSWAVLAAAVIAIVSALGLGKFIRDILAQMLGTLLADAARFTLMLPFRLLGALFRTITRRRP